MFHCDIDLRKEIETFGGFTHHDVALWCVTSYMQFAFRESTPKALNDIFWKVMKTDIDSPLLQVSIPSEESFEIEQPTADLAAIQRLKNYSMRDIDRLDTFDGLLSQSYSPD